MKKTVSWKKTALGAVTLLSIVTLVACGGSSTKSGGDSSTGRETTLSTYYSGDPETLDYVFANKATTGDIVGNLVDGLLEADRYGNFVPSLAEDWTVSEDGKTYTFTLREDAKWFTADGEEYGAITAEDFVTGLKHAADKKSEALYVVQDSIVGLKDYVDGKTTDFSTVGVKAVDEKTVEYTLTQAEPYFPSKTTMGILFPVNAEFLAAQGENFGAAKPDGILYSGPYLLSAMTAKSSIEFTKNPEYWDADNVSLETVKWTYYDESDPESLARGFLDGTYTAAALQATSASYPKLKEEHGDIITNTLMQDVSFFYLPNLARTNYTTTTKTDETQKESTKKALLNKDFRQALSFAIKREGVTAQNIGEDAAINGVRNIQVPTNFVSIDGKSFAAVVNEKLADLGDEWKSVDVSDAQEGLYNADKAKAEFEKAKKALEAEGATFPIQLDLLVDQAAEVPGQMAASFKESVESTLGTDNVVINIHKMGTDEFDNATYYATSPEQSDFDISLGGWGPDYVDPSTYLDIFKYDHTPYYTRFGMPETGSEEVAKAVDWSEFNALIDEASKLTDPVARYTKYAEAQAWLTDSGLAINVFGRGGNPRFTKVVPFTTSPIQVGIKGNTNYKGVEVQSEPVTAKQYEEAKAKYDKEKAKSNAEYQESLAERVK